MKLKKNLAYILSILLFSNYILANNWSTPQQMGVNAPSNNISRLQVSMDDQNNGMAKWRVKDGDNNYSVWVNRFVAGKGWGVPEVVLMNLKNHELANLIMNSNGNAILSWRKDGVISTKFFETGLGWTRTIILDNYALDNVQVVMDDAGNAQAVWTDAYYESGLGRYSSRVIGKRLESGTFSWVENFNSINSRIPIGPSPSINPRLRINKNGQVLISWVKDNYINTTLIGEQRTSWSTRISGEQVRNYNVAINDIGESVLIWTTFRDGIDRFNTFYNQPSPPLHELKKVQTYREYRNSDGHHIKTDSFSFKEIFQTTPNLVMHNDTYESTIYGSFGFAGFSQEKWPNGDYVFIERHSPGIMNIKDIDSRPVIQSEINFEDLEGLAIKVLDNGEIFFIWSEDGQIQTKQGSATQETISGSTTNASQPKIAINDLGNMMAIWVQDGVIWTNYSEALNNITFFDEEASEFTIEPPRLTNIAPSADVYTSINHPDYPASNINDGDFDNKWFSMYGEYAEFIWEQPMTVSEINITTEQDPLSQEYEIHGCNDYQCFIINHDRYNFSYSNSNESVIIFIFDEIDVDSVVIRTLLNSAYPNQENAIYINEVVIDGYENIDYTNINKAINTIDREVKVTATSTFRNLGHYYGVDRIHDGTRSTQLGPSYSWTNKLGTKPRNQIVEFSWDEPVALSKMHLYTSDGYEIQDYVVGYKKYDWWFPLFSVQGNTSNFVESNFDEIVTKSLKIYPKKGPDHQTIYTRINEVELY